MKRLLFFVVTVILLCCCQSKPTIQYSQKEQINFENGLSIIVKEANILPTHLYTYNESIDGKLTSSKRLHNPSLNDKFLFLEIVLDVKNENSESLFIQNEFNFIIETNDVLYPGMLVEEGWESGYLCLPRENKATSIRAEESKKMRLYFWMPEEILDSNLILEEDSSNTQIILDINPITSTWIKLKKGDSIETEDYSMIINDIVTLNSHIQSNDEDLAFYGLKVEIVGKGNMYLYLHEILGKTFAYFEDKSVVQSANYQVISLSDPLTKNDVAGMTYNGKMAPEERREIIFGYNDYKTPSGYIFLKNQNIYYLPFNN